MGKIVNTLCAAVAALTIAGCADTWNKADNQGGLFTSSAEDYVVINHSGGEIMDVYKLKKVIVSSADASDGWIFKDQHGNSINLGGDVKVIRMNEKDVADDYCEYHSEFADGKSYHEVCDK